MDVSFCTLALGARYRWEARGLAIDLAAYLPSAVLHVLTDRPQDFAAHGNVQVHGHRSQAIRPFHDKRFAVAKALDSAEACVFLDADVRVLAPLSVERLGEELSVGVTAFRRVHTVALARSRHPQARRRLQLISSAARNLGVRVEDACFGKRPAKPPCIETSRPLRATAAAEAGPAG